MIYLDNASTTKINEEALKVFNEYSMEYYFNPSSPHKAGFKNSLKLCNMRDKAKELLGIKQQDNLYFCSGATEANNAILRSNFREGARFVVSAGEHPSVLNVCKDLQNKGIEVIYVGLNKDGTVNIDELIKIVSENQVDFVSIMNVSNETGAVNDIQKIVKICKTANSKCLIHSDGVQAVGKIPVNIQALGVDYYTLSGHKFCGPKGVGAFFVGKNAPFKPLLLGGGQEMGNRSGTENLPGIASMVKALEIAVYNQKENYNKVKEIKDFVIEYFSRDKGILFNTTSNHSPYVLSMSVVGLKGEVLVHFLEQHDILIGTGSACSSKKAGNNSLQAMGLKRDEVLGSLRLSFSYNNTMDEIEKACDKLEDIIIKQRELQ